MLAQTDGNTALFISANEKYAADDFRAAIEQYEQILATGQQSAELYYNLGNAYFKTNQLASSILNYERGLLLSPNDEDIHYNLDIANSLITDRIEVIPEFFLKSWINTIHNSLSANTWSLLSLILFGVVGLFMIIFITFRIKNVRRLAIPIMILALTVSIISLLFAHQQNRAILEPNSCIVFSQSVTIKSSPDDSGTNLFVLHEGVKLQITDQLTGWFEIKMDNGNVGWIPANAVRKI